MKTILLSTTYHLKWHVKGHEHIVFTECGKMINMKTGRELKRTINGGYSAGYWIERKFYTLDNLRPAIRKTEQNIF